MSITCLHYGDLHIGKKTHGRSSGQSGLNTRIEDVRDRMSEIADIAENQDVDLNLFCGDLFETTTPTPTQVRVAIDGMQEISRGKPTIMIPGNHEHPASEGRKHALDIFRELNDFYVYGKPSWMVWRKKSGPVDPDRVSPDRTDELVAFSLLPWPLQRLARDEMDVRETYLSYIEAGQWTASELGIPHVVAGHFTVMGSLRGGSEKSLQMGSEVTFEQSDFTGSDYTALAHIHKHQDMRDQTDPDASPVVYCSSPERLSFNEEDHPKGVVVFDPDSARDYEFVETGARDFLTIEVDVRGAENPTEKLVGAVPDVSGAIVRVRYQAEEDQVIDDTRVREALSEAHTIDSIDRAVDVERRERGAQVEADTSLEDQIETFAESRDLNGMTDDLISRAQDICQ